ncbi:SusC/RagA family TonB-linked outer membrane protein [Gracilimonas mengyeensis]|uniref:Iron complex outermembrane recepter protein n=1 Tax=Gracilimonas mengyeensis TaxID=1302730 RepID=A0A521BYG4_9BACT|nr:SusC/RagA family TonB-linked outer membrane protein [Gracilimonas mengyeensis]SMO51621.1 iron complex outermembrane recepter protein [Gracilimonas mengyeensis]
MDLNLQKYSKLFSKKLLYAFLVQVLFSQVLVPNNLLGYSATETTQAVDRTITGTVVDAESGEPLIGVNIVVAGNPSIGTASGSDGTFRLNVPDDADMLVLTYLGYVRTEVELSGQQDDYQIEMQAESALLDEFVVVAYGVQRKSDLTGSISSASTEEFNQGVVTNPGQLLQGVVSGVNVTNASGEPGAAQDVIIRGVGSLRSGTTPLYVIDGFLLNNSSIGVATNPLNFINPNDIESIEVLKDASATAMYGARASNGVVVITTKEGAEGDTRMSLSASAGWSSMANKIDVFSADEFRNQVQNVDGILNDFGANTNWQDELTRTGLSQDINFSMSGAASEQFNYFSSLGVQNQEGILKENNLNRYSGRLNMNQSALNDRLRVDYQINAVRTENLRPNNTAMVVDMLQLNPTIPVYTNGSPTLLDEMLNPVQRYDIYLDEAVNNRILANVAPTFEITDGLFYKLNLGVDYSVTNRDVQTSPFSLLEGFENGSLANINTKNTNKLVENTLTYMFDKDVHAINLLAGHSYQEFFYETSTTNMEGFSDNGIEPRYQDQTSTQITPTDRFAAAEINKIQSFFGRVNYSFDSKYLLTATIRADGSSKFGGNNQYGYFPSFAMGWNISEEDFFNSSFIDNLKVRASWGQTGNQDIPSKITKLSYSESRGGNNTYPLSPDDNNLDQYPYGIIFTRLANPDIQWEVSTQTDVGIDFELFETRLVGSIDYYNKVSDNILLEVVPADPVQPTSTFWTNIPDMEIQNSGIELTLEYRSSPSKTFQYSIGGNVSTINNEVVNSPYSVLTTGAAQGAGQTGATINGYINGEPIGAFYMLEFDGIGEDGLNQFVDTNNDGAVLENDRRVVGSALPNLLYGIQVNMDYKNLGLALNFNGAAGHKIYNHTAMSIFNKGNLASSFNTTDFAVEYPDEANTNSNTVSTRYLEDADYLRLNSATLSYNLRPGLIGAEGVFRNIQLKLTGQNLFTLTNYSGYDPEVNTGSTIDGIQTFGIDRFTYPSVRTFQIGLNLTF